MTPLAATAPVIAAPPSIIPSHKIAAWLLGHINTLLSHIGLGDSHLAQEIVYILAIALIALGIGLLIKYVLLWVTRKAVGLRKGAMAKELIKERLFSKCFHIIPPLVFMALIPFAFNSGSSTLSTIMRIVGIYALIAFAIGICAILTFVFNRYNARMNTKNLPLQGILNIAKGIVWIIVTILAVSVLIDKSPGPLLAGLGAFAAALMLIFKDSILGFVAGIQMSQNDMLRVGDWIVVPSTPANGTVIDVSLTAVKVQNWDNTIVTVPPYSLVSGSFQNWRGMSASGVRRIMQNFTIDYAGVGPCTPELIDRIAAKYPAMQKYIDAIRGDKGDLGWMVNGGLRQVNGSLETNVGLFRLYLCVYLCGNEHISNDHRVLVQLLEPTNYGLPLQIWCWSNTTDWNAYESIQSAVIEHVAKVIGDFGLELYSAGSEDVTLYKGGAASQPAETPADGTPGGSGSLDKGVDGVGGKSQAAVGTK